LRASPQSQPHIVRTQNDRLLSRVLVVKAIHHHYPYTRASVADSRVRHGTGYQEPWTTDGAFRQRIIKGELTRGDVERIISTATHGVVQPDLSPLPLSHAIHIMTSKILFSS
jgi:hypothetical protein